jgi:hypothetical protein
MPLSLHDHPARRAGPVALVLLSLDKTAFCPARAASLSSPLSRAASRASAAARRLLFFAFAAWKQRDRALSPARRMAQGIRTGAAGRLIGAQTHR